MALARIIHVGRTHVPGRNTEVAKQCRSCANLFVCHRTLGKEKHRQNRPKFRHSNGLLDTAYKSDEYPRLARLTQKRAQTYQIVGVDQIGSGRIQGGPDGGAIRVAQNRTRRCLACACLITR